MIPINVLGSRLVSNPRTPISPHLKMAFAGFEPGLSLRERALYQLAEAEDSSGVYIFHFSELVKCSAHGAKPLFGSSERHFKRW